ncbi:RagB/SusD family nutrient uptake outer membrane protein [Dyadobacter crusticola]|uniref:RagB/SusD family nutrient uptake outer membrane protein n=1 Tax=Dyadobacter crusticola TaxID=292407 RepID=UPI0004E24DF0|nr:RagB/SusD family nutrient uptake outer membrane protein [Dyadobacter crusticola]
MKPLVAILFLAALFISCDKFFLDLHPYTEIPMAEAIRSEDDLLAALHGCYAQLRSQNLYGRSLPVIGDLASDNVYISIRNSGKYLAFDQNLITTNNEEYKGIWYDAYTAIMRANQVIGANLPETDQVNQYKGEAHAIRALMYFMLVRTFARPFTSNADFPGVPVVLTLDTSLRPPRKTVREVYAQINRDFDTAFRLITIENGSTRFSKYAVLALAAKVSLYQAQYDQALTLAKKVIEAGGYHMLLPTNLVAYWASAGTQPSAEKLETLLEISADETLNAGPDEMAYLYSQSAYGDLLASASLVDLYSRSDIRRLLVISGKRESAENPAWIVQKYTHVEGDRDNKKVIRLSEMYLIAAEAAYRTEREDVARYYLNELVRQRDPVFRYTSTGPTLLSDIIIERRKELAFEGDRLHDLNRLQQEIHKTDGQFKTVIPFHHPYRIGPIPEAEINDNPHMRQNEGY